MKKIFLLILLPVSLFFSCVGDRIASETMDRAEILLEANPDSAYILLFCVVMFGLINVNILYYSFSTLYQMCNLRQSL